MTRKEEHYSNGEITVVWREELCIHSGRCFRELPPVFDPPGDAFMDLDAASADVIAAQVERCPSGALTYLRKVREAPGGDGPEGAVRVEPMRNGPLLVKGDLVVAGSGATEVKRSGTTAFCRCGHSASKPFCDGAHAESGFTAD